MKRQLIREDWTVQGMFLAGERTGWVAAMFGDWVPVRVGTAGTSRADRNLKSP